MYCKVCYNLAYERIVIKGVQYYECCNCKVLFSEPLDQEGMIGGGAEIERNSEQNQERAIRIGDLCKEMQISATDVHILDWGAGHGLLIQDLKKAGYPNVYGYDPYNPEYAELPNNGKFHIVTSIEVFEHFSAPFYEINAIWRALKNGGRVYTETGFLDAAWEDGIPIEENPYICPSVGHATIWTHHSLDVAMSLRGFMPQQRFNRHVHVYKKG